MSYRELRKLKIDNLPTNLNEAKKYFLKSRFMREIIGEDLFLKLVEAKQKEWEEYSTRVSEWELSNYLEKY